MVHLLVSFSTADSVHRCDQFFRREYRPGIVRSVDLERRFHFVPAVAANGIVHQRDFVPQLRRIANGRVDAGVHAQADHDQLMNAVLLELQIEVGVGKAAGAPVLLSDDFSRSRRELIAKGPAPGAVGEYLRAGARLLDRGPKFPGLVVAGAPAMVWREEGPGTGGTSRL